MTSETETTTPAAAARAAFLARLDADKRAAAVTEEDFRREAAARTEALAAARAYAWRRADLMASLCDVVGAAEDAEMAAAAGLAVLRARLGWDEDSAARTEVLARFAPVAVALFEVADAAGPDAALADFEQWYLETRQSPFWYLFEHYLPDTPRVDF
ncbi:hypothetical protein EZH22_14945 [Xanthobacter dioxanivorans]|uniref:Uncharacterized protein n=1 Tax=Xanthobacter dioxanivorans TaxID=2528964 RepID=A0A974PIY4_9HYPH|nr:hypothetical protein [Xanthobacter dioxanivorans]QRG04497.1 hypothetical protein EZH22_14945 [Xanthobacter dioxanivorans]